MTINDTFEDELRSDLPRGHDDAPDSFGAERAVYSRWLREDEMLSGPAAERWSTDNGLVLGMRGGKFIGSSDDRHLLTLAGNRAGKSVSLLIPSLTYGWKGSAVVIDPKGDLARETAGRRGKGAVRGRGGLNQDVYVLDPFRVSGREETHRFNPLKELDLNSPDLVDDAAVIASSLIEHPQHDRHWTEAAEAVLKALILVALVHTDETQRHLGTVRQLLMLSHPMIEMHKAKAYLDRKKEAEQQARERGEDPRNVKIDGAKISSEEALIAILLDQRSRPHGYVCVGVAEQLASMAERERGSVLSAGRTQTQWLDSGRMQACLGDSDFRLADLKLKEGGVTVYLSLPAHRLVTHAKWLRLIVLQTLAMMERVEVKTKYPVLFLLDEFPVLGHMPAIELAAGLMAGYGVKLWVIAQNVGQLKRHYEKSWETFFANAGVVTAFGIGDNETLKYLSDLLGRSTVVTRVKSGALQRDLDHGGALHRDERRDVPLLAEHEIRLAFGRGKERVLLLNVEENPAAAQRIVYHEKDRFPQFIGLYDPDQRRLQVARDRP